MKLADFQQSWSRALRDSMGKNVMLAALAIANLIAVIGWFQTDRTVVLVPPVLDERLEVSSRQASIGYKKAWALTVAQLAGNVTPGNADLVLQMMGDLLAPEAYRAIAADLAAQIADIKRDSLTVQFEPRQVLYEAATNKVYVTGQFASHGVSGTPTKLTRTYEMKVDIRLGRPWIKTFVPYQGLPVTADSAKQTPVTSQAGTARSAS